MTEEGQIAEEVQSIPDMGESSGGVDGRASGRDDVSHEAVGADDNHDGVESSGAGTPEEPAPDPFSRRFAQLAREQKKLRQEREEMKRLQQEMQANKQSIGSVDELRQLAKEDPYKLVKELGINFKDLSQQVINKGEITPEQKMAGEMKRLRDEIDAMKAERQKLAEEKEAEVNARTYAGFIDQIKTFVNNGDQYEFIKANDAYGVIAEVMQEHYNQTQEVMDYADAARIVENHYEAEAEKFLKVSKFEQRLKERYAPAQTEPVAGQAKEEVQTSEKEPSKTLTNTQVQRAPGDKPAKLSRQQSIDVLVNKYGSSLFRSE